MRHRYADLVRLAYLTLDDGGTPPGALLATARRVVRRAARDARDYPGIRRRLAVALVGGGAAASRPLPRPRPRPGTSFEPAAAPPGPVRTALREMSPHERLVYALHRLEGLTPAEIIDDLGDHLLLNPWDVTATAEAVDDATGLPPAEQQAELREFDPTLVRLRPSPSSSWRVLVAGVLTLVVVGGVAAYGRWRDDSGARDPLLVGAEQWRRVAAPGLDDWPSQGELRDDRDLVRRAVAAWRAKRWEAPIGRVAVLYAGRIDDATVVVLRDTPGVRAAPMVAQYFERRLSRGIESVSRRDGGSGQLIMVGTTWRYLVPPWLTGLSAAQPGTAAPQWRPVAVHGGLTAPLPWWWYARDCQYFMALRMTSRPGTGAAAARPVTVLAGNHPHASVPRVWFRDPDPRRPDTGVDGDALKWAALRATACGDLTSLSDSGDLRIGRPWRGRLPDGTLASLITVDHSGPPGRVSRAALVDDEGHTLSEQGAASGDFTAGTESLAGAVWWRSPRESGWRLLAAAGPGVTRLKATGELGTHEVGRTSDATLLQVPGPDADPVPRRGSRLPVVQVIAYEPDGDRSVITPS